MSTVKERIALLNKGVASPGPAGAQSPQGTAAPSPSATAPAPAAAASPPVSQWATPATPVPVAASTSSTSSSASASASASTPEPLSVAQRIAQLKSAGGGTTPASPSAPTHVQQQHPSHTVTLPHPPHPQGASSPSPSPSSGPNHHAPPPKPTSLSPAATSSAPNTPSNASEAEAPSPPSDRRASGSLADKIAALQKASEKAPEQSPKPAPHKLVIPSGLSPHPAGEGKEATEDGVSSQRNSAHRPSAAMQKLQGGINLAALMGGAPVMPRHSLGARPAIDEEGGEEAGVGEDGAGTGEGQGGRESLSGGRASMSDHGTIHRADSAASPDELQHHNLSRPTSQNRKRPAQARKFVADADP